MKFKTSLISAAAALALGALSLPASAVDYYFNSTAVSEFGAPTYGHVELTEVGSGVQFKVILEPQFNFLTTGNHFVFAFNGNDVSLGDIGTITDADLNEYAKTSTDVVNPPFGTFKFGISCSSNCEKGGSGGGYEDPLTFTVANAVIGDFLVLSTGAGSLGPAYFSADILGVDKNLRSSGYTGSVGVTAAVPEPETYALMLAGLGAMGFIAKRRKAA